MADPSTKFGLRGGTYIHLFLGVIGGGQHQIMGWPHLIQLTDLVVRKEALILSLIRH